VYEFVAEHWADTAKAVVLVSLWFWAYWLLTQLRTRTKELTDAKAECSRMDRALDIVSSRCELAESRLEVEAQDRARFVDLINAWREEESTDRTGLVAFCTTRLEAEALERKSLLDMVLAMKLGTETGDLAPSLGAMMARLRPMNVQEPEPEPDLKPTLPPDHAALIETSLGGVPSEDFTA
jgi:hypothetical protein